VLVELGAGPGFITKRLAELTDDVVAVEIDSKFQPLTRETFLDTARKASVLFEDALKVDFGGVCA